MPAEGDHIVGLEDGMPYIAGPEEEEGRSNSPAAEGHLEEGVGNHQKEGERETIPDDHIRMPSPLPHSLFTC